MKKTFLKQMGLLAAGAFCLTMLFIPGMKARATEAPGDFVINGGVLEKYNGSDAEVTIPSGVTSIGNEAFYEAPIISVTIPEGVTSIGASAFYGCTALDSITLPSSVGSVGSGAFAGCSSLQSVSLGGISDIPATLFEGCISLGSIDIPSGVSSIGTYAFHGCSYLSQVNVPASTSSIDMSAFSGCDNLNAVSVAAGNGAYSTHDGCVYNAAGTVLLYVPAGKGSFSPRGELTTVGTGAFIDATVASVRLPEGVATIQTGAFGDGVENVIIPKSVKEIGVQANWNPTTVSVYRDSYAHNALKDVYDEDTLNVIDENQGGSSGDNNDPNGGNTGDNNDPNGGNTGNDKPNNGNNGNNGNNSSNNGNNGSTNPGGSNSGNNNSTSNGGAGSSGGDNLTKATGSSHVKDNTPTTGDRIDPKYFLFAGVLLIGVYLLISKRNVKDEKKDNNE